MTDEELLLWLRIEDTNLTDFAADRIEAMTKERDDYAHKLMQANNTYTEMHLEIERLSDKLAKAIEALQWCAMYGDGDVALATLAEIKGESQDGQ